MLGARGGGASLKRGAPYDCSVRTRCFLTVLLFLVPVAGVTQPLTQAEVEEAMAVLRADLYEMQDAKTGGWFGVYDKTPKLDDPEHDELLTVTATLALLRSGESPDVEPRLKKAVERVVWGEEKSDEVVATQVVGTRAEIWPLLPGDEHEARLERDGQRLLRAASAAGTFEDLLTDRADAEKWNHRTTQYAIAGIAEAQGAGLTVPDRFWKAAAAHFIAVQAASGGWSLGPDTEPNASATCAGLSVLLTARAEVKEFVEGEKPEPKLEEAIGRGLAFLDGELTGNKTVYGGSGYLFFGLEQVAMRTGRRRLGGAEWFQDMGRYIVDRALSKGDSVHGQVVNASWFLTFLSRGEVPIAFNKLTLGDAVDADERLRRPGRGEPDASGRPDDVNFLTAWLSDTFENELNWQRVALDEPVEGLLSAPASLLMLDGPWEPDAEQQKRLRRYLDLGGLLVIVPAGRTFARVKPAAEKMMEALYPAEKGTKAPRLEQVADDHPAMGLWRSPRKPTRFYAAGNGARTLVLLAGDDLGRDWQQGRRADDAMATGANLYLLASGYGELPPRVAAGFPIDTGPPAPSGRKKSADPLPATVVAVVRCGGLAGREPSLWEATRRRLRAEGLGGGGGAGGGRRRARGEGGGGGSRGWGGLRGRRPRRSAGRGRPAAPRRRGRGAAGPGHRGGFRRLRAVRRHGARGGARRHQRLRRCGRGDAGGSPRRGGGAAGGRRGPAVGRPRTPRHRRPLPADLPAVLDPALRRRDRADLPVAHRRRSARGRSLRGRRVAGSAGRAAVGHPRLRPARRRAAGPEPAVARRGG